MELQASVELTFLREIPEQIHLSLLDQPLQLLHLPIQLPDELISRLDPHHIRTLTPLHSGCPYHVITPQSLRPIIHSHQRQIPILRCGTPEVITSRQGMSWAG